jgi:hypothetical protein
MNAWLAFLVGLSVGAIFACYCVSWLIAAAVKSQAPEYPPEVRERLEAQKEQAPWN